MERGDGVTRSKLGSYAHGQFAVDYEERVDLETLRRERVERATSAMAAAGLDAVLVWKDENVRFLSGLRAQIIQGKSALLNGCLLTRDGESALLLSGGEVDRAGLSMTWTQEVRHIPIQEARQLIFATVEQTIKPLIEHFGLGGARIGIDEAEFAMVQALREHCPEVTLEDGDYPMQMARRVKSPREIALMQEASAIAEALTEVAIDAVRPGVREYEVCAEAMRELYRCGGEMAHLATPFVASGEHMSPPHRFSTDKFIREGDLVFIDIGAMYNGYFSDLGRTIICGRPLRRQQEIYTAVHKSLEAARKAMKVGNTNTDVAEAVLAEGRASGLGDNFLSLFIGHGIGIGSNEPPYIGEALPGAETVRLELGMTMAIEPLIWLPDVPGGGGVRLEDTIVVGEREGVSLTRTAFDERLLLDG
jgi:Xaa-Pro dipeptidase